MRLSKNNSKNRNITRMDHQKVKGCWVRVVKDGKLHQRFFSDGKHGGPRKALAAAREYRDALRRRLYGKHADADRRVNARFARNSSGVVGVSYRETEQAYVASWCPAKGGPQKVKYFSVKKLGKREAFRQAKEFRKARVAEILGQA